MNPESDVSDSGQVEPAEGENTGGESYEAPESAGPSPSEKPFTMADAYAAAKAAAGESPAGDTAPDGPGASDASASTAASDRQKGSERTRLYDERGALQRIYQLRKEGKVGELPPEAQGALRMLEEEIRRTAITEHQQQQQEEAEFKDFYLTNLALQENDPAQFARIIRERPEVGVFMKAYEEAHPEITLDDPDARPRKTEGQMRQEIATEYGRGFEGMIDAIAADGGLSGEAIAKLKAEFKFGQHPDSMNLAAFGGKLVTALAESMAQELAKKEIERVKKEERSAYDLQIQRERGLKAQPPRMLPGGAPDPRQPKSANGPVTMREAFEEAKVIVASR